MFGCSDSDQQRSLKNPDAWVKKDDCDCDDWTGQSKQVSSKKQAVSRKTRIDDEVEEIVFRLPCVYISSILIQESRKQRVTALGGCSKSERRITSKRWDFGVLNVLRGWGRSSCGGITSLCKPLHKNNQ